MPDEQWFWQKFDASRTGPLKNWSILTLCQENFALTLMPIKYPESFP